jgi:hypothetical protein
VHNANSAERNQAYAAMSGRANIGNIIIPPLELRNPGNNRPSGSGPELQQGANSNDEEIQRQENKHISRIPETCQTAPNAISPQAMTFTPQTQNHF